MKTRALRALTVLAPSLLTEGQDRRSCLPSNLRVSALSESQQLQAHHRLQDEGQMKEFKGKILKSGGKFVLEESSNGGNYGTYLLDDQATAKKYEGQKVVVTRTLDAPHNTIHVRKIEAVAWSAGGVCEFLVYRNSIPPGPPAPDPTVPPPPPQPDLPEEPPYPDVPTPTPGLPPFPPQDPTEPEPEPT
jgi:hypothetical protein